MSFCLFCSFHKRVLRVPGASGELFLGTVEISDGDIRRNAQRRVNNFRIDDRASARGDRREVVGAKLPPRWALRHNGKMRSGMSRAFSRYLHVRNAGSGYRECRMRRRMRRERADDRDN